VKKALEQEPPIEPQGLGGMGVNKRGEHTPGGAYLRQNGICRKRPRGNEPIQRGSSASKEIEVGGREVPKKRSNEFFWDHHKTMSTGKNWSKKPLGGENSETGVKGYRSGIKRKKKNGWVKKKRRTRTRGAREKKKKKCVVV